MKQPTLFDRGPPRPRFPWRIIDTGRAGRWLHVASGWTVQHRGGPWPYVAQAHESRRLLVGPNGRGFRTLAEAKAAVELILAREDELEAYFATPNAGPHRVRP